jgi:DNA-binding NtrC family response regulator
MRESGASLLIIDEHPGSLELLSEALAQPGLEILPASSPRQGLELFHTRRPDVVLVDLGMAGMNGMELLDRILALDSSAVVVLMSAHHSVERAVEAVKKGASDYLNKPLALPLLQERVGKLLEDARKRKQSLQAEDQLPVASEFEGIVGRSARIRDLFLRARRVAPHYRAVLITGETGTGKDLVARAIHKLSPAAAQRFVVVNCSAVVETLFESELFGHTKGAFTGATRDKPGWFEHAHGGTLFLDEIGDMPLSTQAKLLRVLQNQEVQRVGALNAHQVNVRVIAATNHDLRAAMAEKRFREDLFYRLSMVELQVPRLADRKDDLPLLQRHFVERFAAQYGKQIRGLTARAQGRLFEHSWPGNVRELENVIGYAAMMTSGELIDIQDLHAYLQAPPVNRAGSALLSALPQGDTFAIQERLLLVRALQQAGWNQTRAARILQITRDRLRYKIKKHHLTKSDFDRASVAAG